MDGGAWQATVHAWGGKESDTTERLHSTLTKIKLFRNTLDGWKFAKMVTVICRSLSFFFMLSLFFVSVIRLSL